MFCNFKARNPLSVLFQFSFLLGCKSINLFISVILRQQQKSATLKYRYVLSCHVNCSRCLNSVTYMSCAERSSFFYQNNVCFLWIGQHNNQKMNRWFQKLVKTWKVHITLRFQLHKVITLIENLCSFGQKSRSQV